MSVSKLTPLTCLCALVLCGVPLAAQPAGSLELLDLTTGASSWPANTGTLVPNHAVTLRLHGLPGSVSLVALSTTPPPFGLPTFGGTPLGVDPATLVVVWNGIANPAVPVIPAAGQLDLGFTVRDPAPVGTSLWLQAFSVAPGGAATLGAGLELTYAGEPQTAISSGWITGHALGQTVAGGVLVFTTSAAWAGFWSQHMSISFPPPPPPLVNFQTDFVVVAIAGWRSSGGYSLVIDGCYPSGGGSQLRVHTTESQPGAGCVVGAVITSPFDIVTLSLSAFSPNPLEVRRVIAHSCL